MIPDTLEELMSPRSFGLLESRNGLGDTDIDPDDGDIDGRYYDLCLRVSRLSTRMDDEVSNEDNR